MPLRGRVGGLADWILPHSGHCQIFFHLATVPALVAGMIGLMLFWVWTYNTSVYLASFFIAKRHRRLSGGELAVAVVAVTSPWILFPLLGLYVSVRLILDGHYRVMGF